MHIISWNLNHRTIEKPIRSEMIEFFRQFRPDALILNEYVDGPTRDNFKSELLALGYEFQLLSPSIGKNNQIFIASKLRITIGDLSAPPLDEASITNFLHVKFNDCGLEIVGFRAPAYSLGLEKKNYWKSIAEVVKQSSNRKIIFIGDINYDPFPGVSALASSIKFGLEGNFYIPNPKGEWSFISLDGKNRTRIDHAIISELLSVREVEYLSVYANISLAGDKNSNAITDHAVLSLIVDELSD